MKFLIFLILMILMIMLSGCCSSALDDVDDTYFKSEDGSVFIIKHFLGDLFFVRPISMSKREKLEIFLNTGENRTVK